MNLKKKKDLDNQFADYTDNILNEKNAKLDETPVTSDPELRALEQTALRLKNAFRDDGPSEKVIQRMHKNIITQWQQQENQKSVPFWEKWMPSGQKWQSQHARQNKAVLLYAATVLGVFLISFLLFSGGYSDQPAATGHNLGIGILVAGLGIVVAAWFFYRQR